eukprot:GEMP01008888.1.p1 GENE.GEMP01008888.1~~GEMP01008888.1.p1  ORF type:complete len:845 (+),score=268.50 GEMP01008888.1:140-2674(+)
MLDALSEQDGVSRKLDVEEAATASLFQTWFDGITWGPFRPIFFTVKTYWWEGYDEHLDALQELDNCTSPCTPGWAGILASLKAVFDGRSVPLPSISRSAFLALGRDFERRSERLQQQWHLKNPEEFCHYFCSTLYRLCAGAIPPVAVAGRVYIPGDTHEDALTLWHAPYSSHLSYIREKLATDWGANFEFTTQTWYAGIIPFLDQVFAYLGLSAPNIPPCLLYQLFREVDTDGTHALTAEDSQVFAETILYRITQLQSVQSEAPETPPRHSLTLRPSRWFPAVDRQHDTHRSPLVGVGGDSLHSARQHSDAAEAYSMMETPRKKLAASHAMDTPPRATSTHDYLADGDQMRSSRAGAHHDFEPVHPKPEHAHSTETTTHLFPPLDATAPISGVLRRSLPSHIPADFAATRDSTTISELRAELAAHDAANIAAVRQKEAQYVEFQRAVHVHVINLEQELKDLQRESADESSELRAISKIVLNAAMKYRTVVSPGVGGGAGAALAETPKSMASMSSTGARLDEQLANVLAQMEEEVAEAQASSSTAQNAMMQLQSQAEEQANARVGEVEIRAKRESDKLRTSWSQEMADATSETEQKWDATVETWRSEAQQLKAELHCVQHRSQGELATAAATWKEKEVDMEVKNVMLMAEIRQREESLQKQGCELQQSVEEGAVALRETERITQIWAATKQGLSNTEHELTLLKVEHQRVQREATEMRRATEDETVHFAAEQNEIRRKEQEVRLTQRELRRESRTAGLRLEELKHIEESTTRQLTIQQQELAKAQKQVHDCQDCASEVETQTHISEVKLRYFLKGCESLPFRKWHADKDPSVNPPCSPVVCPHAH